LPTKRWGSLSNAFNNKLDNECKKSFVASIKELIETTRALSAGERSSDDPLLEQFQVGTEMGKLKRGQLPPPDPKDLRPIREYKFDNPSREILQLKEKKMKNSSSSINSSSILETASGTASTELEQAPPLPQEQEPDYCAIEALCMALCGCFEYSHLESECIGPSIVRMRSQQKQISKNIFNSLVASFRQQVNKLLLPDAEKRVWQYRRKKLKREEQLLPADDEIAGRPVESPAILWITQKKRRSWRRRMTQRRK
jgi:hypothetical protein